MLTGYNCRRGSGSSDYTAGQRLEKSGIAGGEKRLCW
jgi:hypothetical protein